MRATARLSSKLERNLITYATAASAAGLGALALAQSSEAKVIYTPANVVIGLGSTFHLDLNNDGANDVMIYATSTCADYCLSYMSVARDSHGNGAAAFKNYALALRRGAHIGPAKKFTGLPREMVWRTSYHQGSGRPWLNVKNRYLGLRFLVNGETHYGWARLSVVVGDQTFHGTLTGYAYETIADKPIIAGNQGISIAGGGPKPTKPTTLGHLALGAASKRRVPVMGRK